MDVKKNDLVYLLLVLVLAGLSSIAVGNPDLPIGSYSVLGLLGIGAALTILIMPSVGANILIIAIFTNISDILTDQGHMGIIKPLIVLVFGAILVRNIYVRQIPVDRPRTRLIETFLLIYFVVMAISYLAASDKYSASTAVIDFGKDLMIMYCVLFSVRSLATWKGIIWIVILVTFALCLLGVFQSITGNYDQTFYHLAAVQKEQLSGGGLTPRLSGPINEPNMWGRILVAVLPLALYRVIDEKNWYTKLLALGISGVLLIGILNSYSRGAYLGLFVIGALIVIERRPNFLSLFFSLAFVVILINILPSDYITRFQSLTPLSSDTSTAIYQDSSFVGRSSEMLTGLYMFASHPLVGVGAGNYPTNYLHYAQIVGLEYRAQQRDPHSLYIQVLSETGILGFLAFIGLIYSLFVGLHRVDKMIRYLPQLKSLIPWVNSMQISLAGYLTSSIFLHGAYIRYFWILVVLAMTGIQLIGETVRSDKKSTIVKSIL